MVTPSPAFPVSFENEAIVGAEGWVGDEGDPEPRFPLREAVREVCRIVVEGLRPSVPRTKGKP